MNRVFALCLVALTAATPLAAQEEDSDMKEGLDLLEQGTKLLFQGLMNQMGPAMEELSQLLGDMTAFHPPEVLPNGDIIIRRKEPLVPGDKPLEDGEIDL